MPVVCFEQLPEAIQVVQQRAQEKNAPLTILYKSQVSNLNGIEIGKSFLCESSEKEPLLTKKKIGLAGEHQKYNALTAIELCKIWLKSMAGIEFKEAIPEEFKKGLKNVTWPGRGQLLDISHTKYASEGTNATWFLDGAHTIESLEVCAAWFEQALKQRKEEGHRILVFNCTHGRDSDRLLQVMSNIQPAVNFDDVVFTTNVTFKEGYTTDNTNNNVSAEEVTSVQKTLATSWVAQNPAFPKDHVHVVDSIEEAVEFAIARSKQVTKRVQVLTTGSLIMVGNTLTVLGFKPQ